MSDEPSDISQADLAEYCRTQAAILAGHLDRRRTELSDLIAEIEADTANARAALDTEGSATPNDAIADPETAVSAIEAKQERAEAKQAEIEEYRTLAEGYTDLAEQLAEGSGDLETVLQFEMDTDAPAYFDTETTILGVATSDDGGN